MIKEVIMPKVGLTMQTGIIEKWLKKEGDFIQVGEPIFEVSTDKINIEVEATDAGYLKKIIAPEGKEIPVNTVIAYIGKKDEEVVIPGLTEVKKEAASLQSESPTAGEDKQPGYSISTLAKKLAEELNVNLSKVKGSGPRGRILKEDVLRARDAIIQNKQQTAKRTGKTIPVDKVGEDFGLSVKISKTFKLTGIKKLVAERLKESHLNAPPICITLSCDMSVATQLKKDAGKKHIHLTITDIIIKATSKALKLNPLLNTTLRDDNIIVFDEINIGIATATQKGLIVPVIKSVDKLSLTDISILREGLVTKTREGKLTPEDITGGTFTITNLGMYGIEYFEPIITPNQAAILSVGTIKMTPVAEISGGIGLKPIMAVSVTCDHRIADGADGSRFLVEFKKIIESSEELS